MDGAIPSPFMERQTALELYKMQLLQHLEQLRIPLPMDGQRHSADCERDCHIIERNHAIGLVRGFVNSH